MKHMQDNVINLLGEQGERWLQQLPQIIEACEARWHLSELTPIENMTWNYVALAQSKTEGPVVLKIAAEDKIAGDEYHALAHFDGQGMIDIIDYDPDQHILLLRQAQPGTTLKSIYLDDPNKAIADYASLVGEMMLEKPNAHAFKHVGDWLQVFERVDASALPDGVHATAMAKSRYLVESATETRVLHGDLHQDNVIRDGDGWIAIDPKGVLGETAFEVAAFDYIHRDELQFEDVQTRFRTRTESMATALGIDHARLVDWIFVRLTLQAAWMIEDGGDPTIPLQYLTTLF